MVNLIKWCQCKWCTPNSHLHLIIKLLSWSKKEFYKPTLKSFNNLRDSKLQSGVQFLCLSKKSKNTFLSSILHLYISLQISLLNMVNKILNDIMKKISWTAFLIEKRWLKLWETQQWSLKDLVVMKWLLSWFKSCGKGIDQVVTLSSWNSSCKKLLSSREDLGFTNWKLKQVKSNTKLHLFRLV